MPSRETAHEIKAGLPRDDGRTFVLILDLGEEAFAAVTAFANEKAINAASVAAIGAFESAKLGWFDLAAKRYSPISVDEQCEILGLLGDIAQETTATPACIFTWYSDFATEVCGEVIFAERFGPRLRLRSSRRHQTCGARSEQI